MKLLYCAHRGDIVRLFPEKRFGQCGIAEDVGHFSPLLTMRCRINPVSEPDVTFVAAGPDE